LALAVVLAIGMSFVPALAQESAKPSDERLSLLESAVELRADTGLPTYSERVSPSKRFYQERFLPELNNRLSYMSNIDLVTIPGQSLNEHLGFEMLQDDTQRNVERAARDSLSDFMLEETSLRKVMAAIERRAGRGGGGGGEKIRRAGSAKFDVGFSSGLPVLKMDYLLRGSTLSFAVKTTGHTEIEYKRSGFSRTRMKAVYSPIAEWYSVNCLIAF
jgi:hypothetical protein